MSIGEYQESILAKRREGIRGLEDSLAAFFVDYSAKYGLPDFNKSADIDSFFGNRPDWKKAFNTLDLSRDEVHEIVKKALVEAGERMSESEQ